MRQYVWKHSPTPPVTEPLGFSRYEPRQLTKTLPTSLQEPHKGPKTTPSSASQRGVSGGPVGSRTWWNWYE